MQDAPALPGSHGRTLWEPSAPHDVCRSGRYRALTNVMTVAGAAPDLIESHRTSLLTYPDRIGRHLTGRTLRSPWNGVNDLEW
jgi:hypothetical protein